MVSCICCRVGCWQTARATTGRGHWVTHRNSYIYINYKIWNHALFHCVKKVPFLCSCHLGGCVVSGELPHHSSLCVAHLPLFLGIQFNRGLDLHSLYRANLPQIAGTWLLRPRTLRQNPGTRRYKTNVTRAVTLRTESTRHRQEQHHVVCPTCRAGPSICRE